ncbi:hypothetical protein F3Y22_tig00013960pilonHSYRG00139 [Hibiscus syriacus]|uniref:Uncharacterized protein n=1 Tax=Hibiscus syriacus TaxID=106335 RepID=A0A6A3C5L5_HIBSY|nr:hypothetical protein F3Y22_tig00013960pilonHSYRG00139 [Hibiscus syriacus]
MREIACAMHVPTRWASEAIREAMREHPRPSNRGHPTEAIRPRPSDQGHPTEAIRPNYVRACEDSRTSYARASERASKGRSPGLHGDLQGRQDCMATYKVARIAWRPMFGDVHMPCNTFIFSVCSSSGSWPCSRSPGRHGDLRPTLYFTLFEQLILEEHYLVK